MTDRQPLETVVSEAKISAFNKQFNPAAFFGDDEPEDIKECGIPMFSWNPHTGKPHIMVWRCKQFRTCPMCAKIRADDERGFFHEIIAHTNVEKFRLFVADGDEQAKKTALTLGRKNVMYRRYPHEYDVTTFIFEETDDVDIKSVEIDHDDLHKLVPSLVRTEVGKRISGNMHKYLPEKNPIPEENRKYIERVSLPVIIPTDAYEDQNPAVLDTATRAYKKSNCSAMATTMDEVSAMVVNDIVESGKKLNTLQELFDIIVQKTFTELIIRGIGYTWVSQRTYDIDIRNCNWSGTQIASILYQYDDLYLDNDALFDEDPSPN